MTLADAPPPYGTIVFDCDSTLSAMEGIESLATAAQRSEISRLTDAAMCGEVPLEEAFGRRLEIVRPSRADLESVGREYTARALANAQPLIAALRFLGKRVIVVSGGLLPAVEPFARHLGVDETHAVGVTYDAEGNYADFDQSSPLARSGGKIELLELFAARPETGPMAFIGDGITDLEAAHCVARFIAFGGVVRRDAVFKDAAVTCESSDLRDLVPLLLTASETEQLRTTSRHAALVDPSSPSA